MYEYLYGVLGLSFWGYVAATLLMTYITVMAVTLYLHRSQAHRAVEFHPIVNHFFRFWLWLTTGMTTRGWVAIHRKHHAKTETAEDPHSPQILGLRKVLLEGAELYRAESKNQETIEKYSYGTPEDWIEENLYFKHSRRGVGLMFLINLVLFGIPGITIWAVQMMWIPFFAAGVVNGVGHYFGYRNFECPDAATNIVPWGVLLCGEELHNNHHTYASSAKFSVKWWEIDMGWAYIKLLSFFGLAEVKKLPPQMTVEPNKHDVDAETLKAVVINRFQVMARYSREVIAPVLKEEKNKAGHAGVNLFRRAKKLLIREQSLMKPEAQDHLAKLLANREQLALVYQYRLKLQEIWTRTTANQKELLDALRQWCKQAEATGIDALRQFADSLKGYVRIR